jgi:hypothetical protein
MTNNNVVRRLWKEAAAIFLSTFPVLRRTRVTECESGWSSEPVRKLRKCEEYLTRSENGTMIRPDRIPVTIRTMQFRLQIRPSYYDTTVLTSEV